jgi:hypothetical protein
VAKIVVDGLAIEVSPEWYGTVVAPMGKNAFVSGEVEGVRQKILAVSNQRRLTEKERRLLDNLTHIRNVVNTVRVVGAQHDPVKEWGLDGWDAVHGNFRHLECGCVHHYIFDNHSVVNHFGHNRVSKEREHHEIEPRHLCKKHGG